MNRLSVFVILISTLFLSGCITFAPLLPALSITAQTFFNQATEDSSSKISVDHLLAQARNGENLPSAPMGERRLSLSLSANSLDAKQKNLITDFANRLVVAGAWSIKITTGSKGNTNSLVDDFSSYQRGRKISEALSKSGLVASVAVNPKRRADWLEIVATPKKARGDA